MNLPARILVGVIGGLICAALIYYVSKDQPGLSQRAKVIGAFITFAVILALVLLMGGVRYS